MEKQKIFWAGFVDGRIDVYEDNTQILPIFRTKKQARECYEDVRKVGVKEI